MYRFNNTNNYILTHDLVHDNDALFSSQDFMLKPSDLGKKFIDIESNDSFLHFCKAHYYKSTGEVEKALQEIEYAVDFYEEDGLNIQFNNYPIYLYGLAGELFADSYREEDATLMYIQYHKHILRIESCPTSSLYTFRPINKYSLYDLGKKTITVCHPSRFNDPVDSLIIPWSAYYDKHSQGLPHRRIMAESYKYYRVRSFIKDKGRNKAFKNTLMWSHYAEDHTGMCVQYDFSESFMSQNFDEGTIRFREVIYPASPKRLDYESNKITSDDAFLTKARCWRYENEVRLISYIAKEDDFYSIKLDDKSRIRSIYFGVKATEDDILLVKSIIQDPSIAFYKMDFDKDKPHNLIRAPYKSI